jgi:hypothetical protein
MEGVIVLEKEKVKKNCHFKIFNATIMTFFFNCILNFNYYSPLYIYNNWNILIVKMDTWIKS